MIDGSPSRRGEGGADGSGEGGADNSTRPPLMTTPGTSSAGKCRPEDESADVVSVRGTVGALGSVDFTIEGASRGSHAMDGVQRTTDSRHGQSGSPEIIETSLWLWADSAPAKLGRVYEGSNPAIRKGAYMNIAVYASGEPGEICPDGEGTGTFSFDEFQASDVFIASGSYKFRCDANDINVSGCFRYQR